jgi:hypothetical protein
MLGAAVAAAACLLDSIRRADVEAVPLRPRRKDARGSDPFQSRIAAWWFSAHI